MRGNCERCAKELPGHSIAYICTYECTFCHECAENMNCVCPNCQGELVKRPRTREMPLSSLGS
ncbi:DUF1272 domain-containing protein [Gordoniibacillus kamchatkensis]|uniref:DUF1272 domain-containing protein n=1 Tax=Gordoniibacillus kamchatkensis TaxID=1590651 RepID=UPI002F40278F